MHHIRIAAGASLGLLLAGAPAQAAGVCQSGWQVVPSPDPSRTGDNVLKAVAGSGPGDIWAVGQYAPDSNPNVLRTLVAHYDGRLWQAIPSPNSGPQANALLGLAVSGPGHAWAVGYAISDKSFFAQSLIEAWDGSAWQVVAHPHPGAAGHLFAVSAVSADDVWAVGEAEPRIGRTTTLALHFDGMRWSVVDSPNPGDAGNTLYGVVARTADDVWAVGAQTNSGGPDRALLLHWDGSQWHTVAAPHDGLSNTALYAVAAASGGVEAVGEAQNDQAGRTLALAQAAGAGSGAVLQRVGTSSAGDDRLYALAADSGGDWAVGSTVVWPAGGNQQSFIERRGAGAATWTVLPSPNPVPGGEDQLGGVAVIGGQVWIVGDHDGPISLQTLILRSCG